MECYGFLWNEMELWSIGVFYRVNTWRLKEARERQNAVFKK